MTCGLVHVHASYSLPEWQAVKLTFFAPCICFSCCNLNLKFAVCRKCEYPKIISILRGLDLSDLTLDLSLVQEYDCFRICNQQETFSPKYEVKNSPWGKKRHLLAKKKSNLNQLC